MTPLEQWAIEAVENERIHESRLRWIKIRERLMYIAIAAAVVVPVVVRMCGW